MTLPKELTTVTLVSRIAELIVLIAAMIISFGLGVNYQETIDLLKQQNNLTPATINKPQAPIYDLYREPIDSGTSPLSNTIGETANWKTYKNEQLAFSMQYPSEWTYDETTEGYVNLNDAGHKSTLIFFGNPIKARVNGKEENETTGVNLFITPKTKDYNIEQILKKRYFQSDFLKAQNKYGEDISIDGIRAKQIINTKCIRDDCITVLFEKDNQIFNFRLQKFDSKIGYASDPQKDIFYQILFTFRFIE